MNILVTGCNGQLGREVQNLAALDAAHHYIFTDIEELDICNQQAVEALVEAQEVDAIINCAAYTAVDKAEENEELALKLNALAPEYLAEAVERRGGRMMQISTDYVFDGRGCVPYREEMVTNPCSAYGRTKLEGEQRVMRACHRAIIVRTAWLYSPYGNNFVKTMLRLGKERTALGVVCDQVGTPTYALDLARAVFALLQCDAEAGIYHFSNEGVISWYDFTKAIHRIAGIDTCHVNPLLTEQYPTPAQRPHYSVLDKTKIKQTCQIEIPYWEDSLCKCIARLIKNN